MLHCLLEKQKDVLEFLGGNTKVAEEMDLSTAMQDIPDGGQDKWLFYIRALFIQILYRQEFHHRFQWHSDEDSLGRREKSLPN